MRTLAIYIAALIYSLPVMVVAAVIGCEVEIAVRRWYYDRKIKRAMCKISKTT